MTTTVLVVGRRRRALEAARALGLEVVCVDERRPGRSDAALIHGFIQQRLTDRHADWQAIAHTAASGRTIAAVFGLTERAVLPAALLRHHLGLPGDSPEAALRCTDKVEMKKAVREAGLATTEYVDARERLDPEALVRHLGLPLVCKARVSSGGRNNRVCRCLEDVKPLAASWMAEAFVDGMEMSLESLVVGGRPVFVNPTEYFRVRWANILPAPLTPAVREALEDLNRRAIRALGIENAFTHLELFLTPNGPVFGEIAARPPGGYITELIELAYGFDPWQEWLRLGLGQAPQPLPPARQAAGAWVLHPGPGTVEAVEGREAARAVPGVERLRLRLKPGMQVPERVGAGQEVGHLLVTGRDRDEVADRLVAAHAAIRVSLRPAQSV